MPLNIRLTSEEWSKLNQLLTSGSFNKIDAIKQVKHAHLHRVPDPHSFNGQGWRSDVGLKEAKEAVEHYMSSRGMKNSDGSEPWSGGEPSARIVPFQPIRRIVIDMGEGEVEVDMDGMSLKFLRTMTTLKLDDLAKLVDLYNRVRDWEKTL